MKVSYKWLKTMVSVPDDISAFADRLDMTGTAVEDISSTGATMDGIVVGQILTKKPHPNADSLWVTTVDVGANNKTCNDSSDNNIAGNNIAHEPLQIVCGAQNFNAGDKVPVATVGTIMPNTSATEDKGHFIIKKAKLRGIESCGMNCSAKELGLGDDHAGLLILPKDAPVGMPIARYLDICDTVFDLEITPNRPDCMSMLGVAREVAAIYDVDFSLGKQIDEPKLDGKATDCVKVVIDDASRCSRYTAAIIRGVKVGPSPQWLAERVTAAGARSINNVVDATNYIMFELGQPLHAFDLDTLAKDDHGKAQIVVRAAIDGEKFTTLDGIQRTLSNDITVISDGNAILEVNKANFNNNKNLDSVYRSEDNTSNDSCSNENNTDAICVPQAIALAGVMGGLDSEVTNSTTNILLESATFSSSHTSRTSRNLQLFSEAAGRYERGVDAATCGDFAQRAAALIALVAGGTVCEGLADVYVNPKELPILNLDCHRLRRFIGADIASDEAVAILERLGCSVSRAANDNSCANDNSLDIYNVTPPSFRPDLEREIDLYEEILRIWGMQNVPLTLPTGAGRIGLFSIEQIRSERIGASLRAMGINETMTYAFASPQDMQLLRLPVPKDQKAVSLLNPMNADQSVMRQSIIPGLLRSVAYNLNHGVNDVHLYEAGVVFSTSEGRKLPRERKMLACVLCGSWHQQQWNETARRIDFFDVKGIIQSLLRELNCQAPRFKVLESKIEANDESSQNEFWLQPGRAASVLVGSLQLGWVGEIHPLVLRDFDVQASVLAFELDFNALLVAANAKREYKDVPQYPAVERDIAITLDTAISCERVEQVIRTAAGALLYNIRLFDVYKNTERLGVNKQSLAFALEYRSSERTLTADEVDKLHNKVLRKLTAATGGKVRGSEDGSEDGKVHENEEGRDDDRTAKNLVENAVKNVAENVLGNIACDGEQSVR
ncbi:MAG: phenylalanine--tRNA ligase subunit beta [Coriobacteriales bacterium]|jgi:phenylalanyl-tRNA synthetase beta chain|nr:phenylalanine--tRNA ligase subunit beta [Coriobacteriales bacterium]